MVSNIAAKRMLQPSFFASHAQLSAEAGQPASRHGMGARSWHGVKAVVIELDVKLRNFSIRRFANELFADRRNNSGSPVKA